MRALLEKIPVRLVEQEQLGFIGAARSFFDTHESRTTSSPSCARGRGLE
jgi:hypothetical protein